MNVNETLNENTAPADEENLLIVKFSKPYQFEGNTYKEVDLSGLDSLTAEDMIAADRYLSRNGNVSIMPEMSVEYACFIACRATSHPIEFFRRLPPKDAMKVKNRVTNFIYGEG
jgi:hypothetical protein